MDTELSLGDWPQPFRPKGNQFVPGPVQSCPVPQVRLRRRSVPLPTMRRWGGCVLTGHTDTGTTLLGTQGMRWFNSQMVMGDRSHKH